MNRREKFSRRTRVILTIILVVLLTALIIYVVGLASQTVARLIFQKAITIVFNPLTCFRYAFLFDYSKYVWLAVGVIAVVLLGYSVTMSDRRGKMDATRRAENGNFDYSHKETYGSAKQMTTGEIKKFFKVLPATVEGMSKTNGDVVFGFLNEKKKKIVSMPDRDWSKGTDYNRNIAVCGPPGTGKTRAFVMNYIISKLSAGESLYVVDTKGEIYAKTCSFAKAQGYEVKILNLIETDCSDGWDVLGEVENDPEMAMELAATVIRNTGGAKTDPFWNDAEMNILKAVILLKSVGEADISNRTGTKQTLGDVYRYVATRKLSYKEGGAESMEADFRFLREYTPNHPAVTPFLQFQNAGDDVCKKILHGLANRLQLFQNEQLSKVLGTKDIDLIKSGTSKCIYYLRFSDQTSTYSFITALFFSFMFVKLIGYADTHGGKLPVPVNMVADEFINIGTIPDFEKKISTARSRNVNIIMIYQSNMLFASAYPDGLWEAILAACDVFLVLGVGNELTTSEYVSKMTGEATTSVSSNSIVIGTNGMRSTSSTGRRYVKTTDEIRRLDKKNLLVFVRDRNVIELRKMDYTENPIYKANKALFAREVSVADHVTKVEKADVNYDSFRFSDIDRSRFVSDMSGRGEDKRKSEPEQDTKHYTTEKRPSPNRSRGPRGL